MKSAPVIALMTVAIVVATVLHAHKNNHETDDIDEAVNGLKGITQILPPDSHVFIRQYDVPDGVWLHCRYALMPRYSLLYRADFNRGMTIDTIIAVTSLHPADSIMHSITDHRKLLWQQAGGKYNYYLTCNNR